MVVHTIYSFVTKNKSFLIAQLIIWLFSFGLFGSILYFGVWSDLHLHIEAVRGFLRGTENLPTHFLYFILVAILGIGQANMYILSPAAGILLATAVWAKYVGSTYILENYADSNRLGTITSSDTPFSSRPDLWWVITAFILIFVFTLPGMDKHMGGQLPPNVWHNSTTIFLMPFALALCWFSFQFLETKNLKLLYPISIFLVLNVLIKPSFVLCFGPIFPLFCLYKLGLSRKFFMSLIPLFITGFLLMGEYSLIYLFKPSTASAEASGIEIVFLKDWARKSNFILLSLFASIAYPLLYLFLYWKTASKELFLQYVWALFFMAILILLFIVETGPRATHGNFRWQAVVCNYLLFLGSTMSWGKQLNVRGWHALRNNFKMRDWMLLFILGLHLISGMVYLVRIFVEKTTLL